MKTAMQELIEKWENELGSYIPNAPIYKAFIEDAKTFLEKEKQQIINAHEAGQDVLIMDSDFTDSRQYYSNTFEQ